jgi:amidase
VGPGVAPKHEQARYWNYTSLWNLLDYPAAVFPVSSVKEKEDSTRGPFLDEQDEWNWKQCNSYLRWF